MIAQPLSKVTPRPIDWLWPGRLARGKLTLFDGDPGLGKSWVALDLCARLTRGACWPEVGSAAAAADGSGNPGRFEPANALILSAEDNDADTLAPRLYVLGADPARTFIWPSTQPWPLLPRDLKRLEEEIALTQAKLVVLDPLAAFLEPHVAASNDTVRRLMDDLGRLAERSGCALLAMRHLAKHVGGGALYRGLGPISFMGVCRLPWFVARDPKRPGVAVLASPKNNLAAEQPALTFRIPAVGGAPAGTAPTGAAPALQWLGPAPYSADELLRRRTSRRDRRRARARRFLERYLSKHGPALSRHVKAAARRARLSWSTVKRARTELQEVVIIDRVASQRQLLSFWRLHSQQLPAHLERPPDRHDLDPWLDKLTQPQ